MTEMDALSRQWCSGWETACQKIKDLIVSDAQKINDKEAVKIVHSLIDEVQAMEKRAIHEMPTLVSRKIGAAGEN